MFGDVHWPVPRSVVAYGRRYSTSGKLEADYQTRRDEVMKLERPLSELSGAKPVDEVRTLTQTFLHNALADQVRTRTKIAAALPDVIGRITCYKTVVWRRG